jgi:hypothetical protein
MDARYTVVAQCSYPSRPRSDLAKSVCGNNILHRKFRFHRFEVAQSKIVVKRKNSRIIQGVLMMCYGSLQKAELFRSCWEYESQKATALNGLPPVHVLSTGIEQ